MRNITFVKANTGMANKIPTNPNKSPKEIIETITIKGCKPTLSLMILGVIKTPSIVCTIRITIPTAKT